MIRYVDMHMHAGFMPKPEVFAKELEEAGIAAYSNTVTPLEYLRLSPKFDTQLTKLGVGLHPWWIGTVELGSIDETLMLFEDGLEDTRYVGEVGLDFMPKREHTVKEQLEAFKFIAALCAYKGDCLISMHSVHGEKELLDILSTTGCIENCACVLHSYSGPSDMLKRAINEGCYFSVGERMLSSKKGREYARIIPDSRLLIESDLPDMPGEKTSVDDIESSLSRVLDNLSEIRVCDRVELQASIAERSLELLNI